MWKAITRWVSYIFRRRIKIQSQSLKHLDIDPSHWLDRIYLEHIASWIYYDLRKWLNRTEDNTINIQAVDNVLLSVWYQLHKEHAEDTTTNEAVKSLEFYLADFQEMYDKIISSQR